MEPIYVLNHFYKLRHDIKRSYILSPNYVEEKYEMLVRKNWISMIHPMLAMALSLFSIPCSLQELIKKFSYFFDVSVQESKKFVSMFLHNENSFVISYKGREYIFPKNIVIESSVQFRNVYKYSPEDFVYTEIDLQRERFYVAPASIVFMVNNTCVTDCIYCYANKKERPKLLDFNRIKEIVEEAKGLFVNKFSLVGGEVFLYKYWRELLALLRENNLNETLISTKVPLKEADIDYLKEFDMTVQVSLDAIQPLLLKKILNVSTSYAGLIKHTIYLLNKKKIKFQISTVLTKYNCDIRNLDALYAFLKQFEYLQRWEIRVAFKSLYSRENFDDIKISKDSVDMVDEWVCCLKDKERINISWNRGSDNKYFTGENGSRSFSGARCSANYSNLFILPDGKVTICEQLYWNPMFLIGDLSKETIKEIWNSPRALALAFPKRENLSDKSACKTCKIFDDCMLNYPNRCIADIIKGYGMENWDYPDPRCAKAPQFIYNLLKE
jgi:radical SAM protein with 4Fe4S-binding SPASM domain